MNLTDTQVRMLIKLTEQEIEFNTLQGNDAYNKPWEDVLVELRKGL